MFTREQLIEEEVIRRTSGKEFENRYLKREYDKNIIIIRVIDSRKEKFVLSKAYKCQVKVITVITAPEIEMLIIAGENKYNDYKKYKTFKPCEYCKSILKMEKVKKPEFILEYFKNTEYLIRCIKIYHKLHKQESDEITLYDLIKENIIKEIK